MFERAAVRFSAAVLFRARTTLLATSGHLDKAEYKARNSKGKPEASPNLSSVCSQIQGCCVFWSENGQ